MSSAIEVPEIVALCQDGKEQAVGWAMVLPQTHRVVAHVPDHTGTEIGLLNTYSSPGNAGQMLACVGIYAVPDWPILDTAPRARCCPTCTCAVVAELSARG